ncbi:DUF1772 domain-containing protein [Streptomyces radicis]|uniref:DUF1772 domain-containing protein n=1 Tax=Streptomyces radicis TaxID=1750517 RepID=A0A3A9W8G6_9ACTN|nr:anthrone oxygenase family protein [Streptomyces radicis]RKN03846.1 DUF1772 domain-containing protein [Streptomyces radicis]RKN13915.1 DUF1772 domain-containing protein [Streptomyces radicis]
MPIVAAVTAALALLFAAAMTGVFFAFSVSVMPGLDAVEPPLAVRSMQSFNVAIVNPAFLLAFLGLPVAALATGVLLILLGHRAAGVAFLASGAVYALGALLPTGAVNVPMNDTLAALGTPESAARAAEAWADYAPRWTRWNHVRAVVSGLSLLLAALGSWLWGRDR